MSDDKEHLLKTEIFERDFSHCCVLKSKNITMPYDINVFKILFNSYASPKIKY